MSEPHLLAFHIGPVQDFIATARRTQDLWMGSWLLSRLSYTAMKTAHDQGAIPILPKELPDHSTPDFDPAIAEVPNHFMARVPADKNAVALAEAVEAAVKSAWETIHSEVKRQFFANVSDEFWKRV